MNKKNNKIRNRLLAFSLAFALCMGAFAGFTMTTRAASNAYNTLKASIKRVNTVLGDRYEFEGYDDETIYPLLDQLSESEWTTLKNETTINGISPLDRYGSSKTEYNIYKNFRDNPSDEANPTNQSSSNNNSNNNNNNVYNDNSSSTSGNNNSDEEETTIVTTKIDWSKADEQSEAWKQHLGTRDLKYIENNNFRAPLGTQFWGQGDMVHYRVTKTGTANTFGEVQIIGWESWNVDSSDITDYSTSNLWLWSGPSMGIAPNNFWYQSGSSLSQWVDSDSNSKRYDNMNYKMGTASIHMFAKCNYNGEWFIITSIAPKAFQNRKDIEFVYIPDTVKEIPAYCFKGCTNLKCIAWGSNALKEFSKDSFFKASTPIKYNTKKRIKTGAFQGCTNLKTFYLYGLYADIKVDKNAFKKDKKTITVKTYNKNKYTKKFIENISTKGKAKKNAKTKWGVPIHDGWDIGDESGINKAEVIKGKSKKSSKKKK